MLDLPVNVLFSQPSLVDGYETTPCTECHSPIATRQGSAVPERCDRAGCSKFDRFPMTCLALLIHQGGFKTICHKNTLSLVVDETPSLRCILTPDFEGFWIPRRATDRKRFKIERTHRRRLDRTLGKPPVWTGECRPQYETVPLSQINQTLSEEEIQSIHLLGLPIWAMAQRLSLPPSSPPFRTESQKTRRELGEIVIVKTPFNQMEPEQREQHTDHHRLMQILSGMRLDFQRQTGLYDVIVLGKSVKEVSEARGMNLRSLAVTVSRIRAKMD
jgi:hypothetical protein